MTQQRPEAGPPPGSPSRAPRTAGPAGGVGGSLAGTAPTGVADDDDRTRPIPTGDPADRPGSARAPEQGPSWAWDAGDGAPGEAPRGSAAVSDGPRDDEPAGVSRPVPRSTPRPSPGGSARAARTVAPPSAGRSRKARLRLQRVDPWSVFVLALLLSLFLAVVVVVAVVALYAVLSAAGVPETVNDLVAEVTRASGTDAPEPEPLLTAGRALTTAGVIAVVDVVLLTVLSTLAAVLYNLCASFTGGLEVTLAEPDER